jgi:hypothetical protein
VAWTVGASMVGFALVLVLAELGLEAPKRSARRVRYLVLVGVLGLILLTVGPRGSQGTVAGFPRDFAGMVALTAAVFLAFLSWVFRLLLIIHRRRTHQQ